MRHRAVVKAAPQPPPRTQDERRLEQLQRRISEAQRDVERLTRERDLLALSLWMDERMAQTEIAERLDRADRRAGGEGVTYAQVQKRLFRMRAVHHLATA